MTNALFLPTFVSIEGWTSYLVENEQSGVVTQKEYLDMARVQKSTDSSSLAEVVDRILDKGIVIDAWVKVSLVGIELLSIEARVVIASVETYLKYAEAIGLTASAATPA